ncbi:coiled-coil domain-containing protein [Pseudotamlana agarivorans]|uniref:hypothetical protein n=1 Tax=Pseudotamlana agarivorans TaxID=481183 RepID=UPI0008301428|nr:hypothetical protein [Tamlana agarivorans]
MPQQIAIAELNIDNKKLLSSLQSTKKSIEDLTATQKELKNAGETTSKTFIQNEADLKSLKQEYNSQVKVLQATTGANQKLNDALSKEIKTVDEAKANNAELVKVRNQLNASTDEGAKAIETINKKMDENNGKINENSSSLEKQKQNIGNYPEALDKVTGGLGGVVAGFKSMTKASLSFIATPIGALLAVLVGAFALVKNAMDRSEDSTNKIKKAFSAFQGITNTLLKILEPLGEFLIDGLVKGFELAEKAIYAGLSTIASGLDLLGFDKQANAIKNFNKEVQQGAKDAKALADAEAQLTKAQREAQKIQLEYQRDAEKLRQIRDDESKSMAERIKANDELGKVLKNQLSDELSIAQLALQVANERIKAEGSTKTALDEQAEALTNIADIQERITGQESEQLVNLNSLRKEASEKAIALMNDELEKYIESQGVRAKTLEEQLAIDEQVAQKRVAILQKELATKSISQAKFDAEYLKIQNELADAKANAAVTNAQIELDNYIRNNYSKLDNDKFFSEESLKVEQERLDALAQKQRDFAKLQFEEGVINKTEYDNAIAIIDDDNYKAKEEVQKARKEAQIEAEAIDYENQLAINEERFTNEFDLAAERLEQQRLQEVANAEQSGADISLINEKYANYQEQLEKDKQNSKLAAAGTVFNGISDLLGKESAAGKAAAVAAAAINTAQGVTKALADGGLIGIATGALVGAVGAVNIAKIVSTKPPKRESANLKKAERGMLLRGARHSQGGIPIEAEDGEAIINRRSTSMFLPLLSELNQAGGGVPLMANGGIAGRVNIPNNNLINTDDLATKIAIANQSLPAPIVSVEEISTVNNRVNVIETNSIF